LFLAKVLSNYHLLLTILSSADLYLLKRDSYLNAETAEVAKFFILLKIMFFFAYFACPTPAGGHGAFGVALSALL